jgi:hypothetical protein
VLSVDDGLVDKDRSCDERLLINTLVLPFLVDKSISLSTSSLTSQLMSTTWLFIKARARGNKKMDFVGGERLRVCVNIDMATYEQSLTRGRLSRKLRVCALEWPNNLDPTALVDPVALLMHPTAADPVTLDIDDTDAEHACGTHSAPA